MEVFNRPCNTPSDMAFQQNLRCKRKSTGPKQSVPGFLPGVSTKLGAASSIYSRRLRRSQLTKTGAALDNHNRHQKVKDFLTRVESL